MKVTYQVLKINITYTNYRFLLLMTLIRNKFNISSNTSLFLWPFFSISMHLVSLLVCNVNGSISSSWSTTEILAMNVHHRTLKAFSKKLKVLLSGSKLLLGSLYIYVTFYIIYFISIYLYLYTCECMFLNGVCCYLKKFPTLFLLIVVTFLRVLSINKETHWLAFVRWLKILSDGYKKM